MHSSDSIVKEEVLKVLKCVIDADIESLLAGRNESLVLKSDTDPLSVQPSQ